ncbi:unnamed protein product, partial [Linum tenue]
GQATGGQDGLDSQTSGYQANKTRNSTKAWWLAEVATRLGTKQPCMALMRPYGDKVPRPTW